MNDAAHPNQASPTTGRWAHQVILFRHFLIREIKNRFLGSFSGGLWALLQPLIQLAIYAFVFVHIFKARLPGAGGPAYVPFLVAALWPWTAFSEAVMRATNAVVENAALIGKVAVPRALPVLASIAASFLLHAAGFIAVMLALPLFGYEVHLIWLPLAIVLFIPLLALATGFGMALAALQVFVRDLSQITTQLLTLAMFAAPIFYARTMMPPRFRALLALHPFTYYAEAMRSMLLNGHAPPALYTVFACAAALIALLVGVALFRRLESHFEDFL